MKKIRLLFFLIISINTFSCATIRGINLLTTQEEISIGQKASEEVESQMSMYNQKLVNSYLDSLGQVLVRKSKRQDLKY